MTNERSKSVPLYRALYSQVLFGIVLGIVFGYVWPSAGALCASPGTACAMFPTSAVGLAHN